MELLRVYPRQLLVCFLVTLGGTVAFYTYSVNGPATVKAVYQGQGMTATWINFTSLAVLVALQPVGGLISDRVGRRPLLVFFGVGALVWTWFVVLGLRDVRSPVLSWAVLVLGYVVLTGYTSINAVVKAGLFPAHVRALGVGFGYALANSAFGGTAPLLYEAAKKHDLVGQFAFYVVGCVAVSLIVYVFVLRDRAPTYLDS